MSPVSTERSLKWHRIRHRHRHRQIRRHRQQYCPQRAALSLELCQCRYHHCRYHEHGAHRRFGVGGVAAAAGDVRVRADVAAGLIFERLCCYFPPVCQVQHAPSAAWVFARAPHSCRVLAPSRVRARASVAVALGQMPNASLRVYGDCAVGDVSPRRPHRRALRTGQLPVRAGIVVI